MSTSNQFDFSIPKNIIGLCNNIFAILFCISPIFMLRSIHRNEIHAKDIAYSVMLLTILNCLSWLSFGIITKDFFIKFGNTIGLTSNLIYLSIYFYYRFIDDKKLFIFSTIGINLFSISLWVFLSFILKNPDVSKFTAMIFNILMFISPSQKLVCIIIKYKILYLNYILFYLLILLFKL
jgi:hypothetical protein